MNKQYNKYTNKPYPCNIQYRCDNVKYFITTIGKTNSKSIFFILRITLLNNANNGRQNANKK